MVLGCLAAHAIEPANPHANPKTRAILSYIAGLEGKSERRILSGQFAAFGNGAGTRLLSEIHDKTGHWPALLGVDYADFGRGGLTFQVPNAAARQYWEAGGLVTASAHLYNPARTNGGGLRDQGVDLKDLLAENTETHRRWIKELDELAGGLGELQDAGVVVLWRPFHEMNGGWFWWGAKDPSTFQEVWRQMFDYFTQTKHLNNLLWVYAPNHGDKTAAYYAGDKYVDIVGLDAYTDDIDTKHIKGYAEVALLPKPFGFTEFGPHGSSNPPGNYDYLRFLQGVTNQFQRTVFFMSWNGKWSLASNSNTPALLNDVLVVNREDLPAGLVR